MNFILSGCVLIIFFIKEDIETAHNLALNMLSVENLQSSELVELARCFQLLGDKDNTLACLEKPFKLILITRTPLC